MDWSGLTGGAVAVEVASARVVRFDASAQGDGRGLTQSARVLTREQRLAKRIAQQREGSKRWHAEQRRVRRERCALRESGLRPSVPPLYLPRGGRT